MTVLLALAQNDYDGAKSALNTAATLTADGLDARLLRAQIRLERGEADDIRRGRQLLERLADPTQKRYSARTRMDAAATGCPFG